MNILVGLGRDSNQARTVWWGPIRDENIAAFFAFSLYYLIFIPSMRGSSSNWRSCPWQNDSAKICIKIIGKGMWLCWGFWLIFLTVMAIYMYYFLSPNVCALQLLKCTLVHYTLICSYFYIIMLIVHIWIMRSFASSASCDFSL